MWLPWPSGGWSIVATRPKSSDKPITVAVSAQEMATSPDLDTAMDKSIERIIRQSLEDARGKGRDYTPEAMCVL